MDKKTTTALIVAVIVLVLDMLLYTFKPLGSNFYIISDSAVIIYALIAVIFGFRTAKEKHITPMHKKALQLIVFGALSWFVGEVLWGFQEIFLNIKNPFPSIADAFWLLGYLLVLAGIYCSYQIAKTQEVKIEKVIALLVFMAAFLVAVVYFIYPKLIDPELTTLGKVISFAYVFLDLMMVFWIMALLYLFYTNIVIQSWVWISISMIFLTIADFLYAGLAESYTSDLFIGMLWDAHYIVLAFGFFYYRQTIEELIKAKKKKS